MPWTHRDRRPQPVALAPRHRRVWRRLRRYCSCGLRWTTCPDRRAPAPAEPDATQSRMPEPGAAQLRATTPGTTGPARRSPAPQAHGRQRPNGGRW